MAVFVDQPFETTTEDILHRFSALASELIRAVVVGW